MRDNLLSSGLAPMTPMPHPIIASVTLLPLPVPPLLLLPPLHAAAVAVSAPAATAIADFV